MNRQERRAAARRESDLRAMLDILDYNGNNDALDALDTLDTKAFERLCRRVAQVRRATATER